MNQEQQQFFDRLKVAVANLFGVTPEHLLGDGRYRKENRQFTEAFELFLYFIYERHNHSRSGEQIATYAKALGMTQSVGISNTWLKLHSARKHSTRLATQIRQI